jgi:hypothetical protein
MIESNGRSAGSSDNLSEASRLPHPRRYSSTKVLVRYAPRRESFGEGVPAPSLSRVARSWAYPGEPLMLDSGILCLPASPGWLPVLPGR